MRVAHDSKRRGREAPERPPFYRDDAFWRGVASAFNMTGYFTPKYYGRDPQQADYEALRGDWEAVGGDLERVMRRYEDVHLEYWKQARQARLFDPDKM